MSGPFKVGQRVICIEAGETGGRLENGQVYTVILAWPALCKLDGVPGTFSVARFQVAEAQQASLDEDLIKAGMFGQALKFRSGCPVKFIAYIPEAKPHCQLVLLNPATGNTVTRYANGKASTEPYDEPGDILVA